MKPFYSFDVFDTVLTRNVYQPQDLFLRIQNRLMRATPQGFHQDLCRDYRNIRMSAEKKAREQLEFREEVTLRDILKTVAGQFDLSDAEVSKLEEMEIFEELNSTTAVGSAAALVNDARQRGRTIGYVSDMYLPDRVIEAMLLKEKLFKPGDSLFVSGSQGIKKSTGSLFRHVLAELQIQPNQVVHLGDYLLSDFLVPQFRHGIRSFPVRTSRNNIYERLWGDPCHCLYCSSVAGASRAARVVPSGKGDTALDVALYNLGCNVLGPILAGFTLWMLRQAEQAGVRRLYFLSRDGEILLEVAKELVDRLGISMELRYLHVSRTSVFPAAMGTGVDARTIGWLKEATIVLTVRILADRLKVAAAVLYRELLRAGHDVKGLDSPLDDVASDRIFTLLVSDPVLNELLAQSGQKALQNLAGYLDQELLFDGTACGLVDLGWHGGIQDVIHACFADRFGANGISGYYFGVDLPGKPGSDKSGYFVDHSEDPEFHRFRHLFRVLIELLCSGSHGMVRNFGQNGAGSYVPSLDEMEHPGNWSRIRPVRQGCQAFVRNLDGSSIEGFDYRHVRPQILSVFKNLFFFPSRDEAVALGGLYFSADQAGHGLHQVAPPFTLCSASRFLAKRSYAGRSSISSWFFASWTRSSLGTRLLLSPLVLLLRLCYCGTGVVRLAALKLVDSLNASISVRNIHL